MHGFHFVPVVLLFLSPVDDDTPRKRNITLITSWYSLSRLSVHYVIDLFHNGGQIKYSSVLMQISLSGLATTSKFQKNICFKMRPVGLININTKQFKWA